MHARNKSCSVKQIKNIIRNFNNLHFYSPNCKESVKDFCTSLEIDFASSVLMSNVRKKSAFVTLGNPVNSSSACVGIYPEKAEVSGLPSVTNADFLRTFDINTELAKSISNDVQKS